MEVCMKLAVRSLRKNRGRTLVTLLGILLSVLMACAVLTLLHSLRLSAVDAVTAKEGNWHIAVYHAGEELAAALKGAEGVLSVETAAVGGQEVCRIVLQDPGEAYGFAEAYLEGRAEYAYHTELLSYLGVSRSENVRSLIGGVAAVLLLIIAAGGGCLIGGAFGISVSQRTKELGLLSSLGAEKKDLRRLVYAEAFLLGTAAVLPGMGLGLLTAWAVLDVFGAYMGRVLYVDLHMGLHINGWLLLAAAAFSYLLVFLSAGMPARAASKISIIGNLKGEKAPMRVRHSDFITPAEALLARRSRRREKKAVRGVVFSLAVSIFLFVSANGFSMYMLSFVDAEREKIGYDLRLYYPMELGEEGFDGLYRFVQSQDGIDEMGWFAESPSHHHSVLLPPEWVTDGYRASAGEKNGAGLYRVSFFLFLISDERYEEFLSRNGLAGGGTVYASAFYGESAPDGASARRPILKDGSYRVHVRYLSEAASARLGEDILADPSARIDYEDYYDASFTVPITVGSYAFPMEFRPHDGGLSILLPESRGKAFHGEITGKEIMVQTPNHAGIQKNTASYLAGAGLVEKVSLFDSAESYASQRNLAAMIQLFSAAFLTLLSGISCANVLSVVTAGVHMRRREFGVLRSMGMEEKRLFRMLSLENLASGVEAALVGSTAALPLCWLLCKSIGTGGESGFVFPVKACLTASLAMLAVMLAASVYGLRRLGRGAVIADIRNDFT